MNNPMQRLPDTELEVMKVIWEQPTPISTTQIKNILDLQRPWNIGALQTLLNRLIKRGFIKSGRDGKRKTYVPLIAQEDYLAWENKSFLRRLNNGSITNLVASLYHSHDLSDEGLKELQSFIDSHTNGRE